MRTELDDDDAVILARRIREEVRREVEGIRIRENVDLEAWWGLRQTTDLERVEGKNSDRDREKL